MAMESVSLRDQPRLLTPWIPVWQVDVRRVKWLCIARGL